MSTISILNCPFIDHVEVAETKIDAAAAKNVTGVPHGVKERPWGPFFDQKLSGFRIHNADAGSLHSRTQNRKLTSVTYCGVILLQ
jgi:hypothetical protein